ncbi:cupin domain-containing protein [Plantactinospora soyae]|uniref:Quercetin dioxygenase-like cupin family protein n=1 Tax=Plantactinospora soyae TaxID=1544732 RepID=A0A927M7U6_9ACTN|nr:cupin domain-containing protein [Plantactinospora soyae]MBE1488291.1 quercetin dioxygenase-like cupin family protein [Plantactinospora soyae]
MNDFVVRRWDLDHYPGDQAPPHVHHRSDEAFCVLRGRLEVLVGGVRRVLEQGEHVTVPAGTTHTFATIDADGAQVLVVMTPEVDQLVTALHAASTDKERAVVWARYNSEVMQLPGQLANRES